VSPLDRTRPDHGDARITGAPVDSLAGLVPLLAGRGDAAALVQMRRERADSTADSTKADGADADAETWSAAALADVASRVARGLQDAGVEAGDRILLYAPSSPRWIIACLGLLRLGAIPVPVDSQADAADLAHIVAASGAGLAFTAAHLSDRLAEAAGDAMPAPILLDADDDADEDRGSGADAGSGTAGRPDAEAPAAEIPAGQRTLAGLAGNLDPASAATGESGADALPSPDAAADAEAVLFFTSGTSGAPKGVPLTHRNLLANLGALLAEEIVSDSDRMLLPLPLHHVYPFTVGLLAPLARGVPVVLPQALTGPALARALDAGDVSVILGIPRLYDTLLGAVERRIGAGGPPARWAFRGLLGLTTEVRRRTGVHLGRPLFAALRRRVAPRLRLLISGGAPLDPELGARLEGFGWSVAVGYGLTETSPILTIVRPGERRFDSAGRALPGVELRIGAPAPGDEDAPDVPPEKPRDNRTDGELEARGPNVFSGYLAEAGGDEDPFTDDGWFRTGDLGRLDDDGWLHLSGRASSRIVLAGGENVDPEAVEARLDAEPAVAESGVLAHDGALAAVLVPDADILRQTPAEALPERLREAADAALADAPDWRRPTRVEIDRRPLPRTRLGKLRRGRLGERFAALVAGEAKPAEAGLLPLGDMAPDDRALVDDPAAARVWQWLGERFEGQRVTPETDLRLDLGMDSLEWVAAGIELQDAAGVALDEDAIGRVETIRDLLREATAAGTGAESQIEDLEARLAKPEAVLDDDELARLAPTGRGEALLASVLHGLARLVMRWWFRLDAAGMEHLPPGPCILAPNHESALDPIAVAAVLPGARRRMTFWGGFTERMFSTPWMRLVSRAFRVLPVAPARRPVTSLAYGAAALARGGMLVWFPEGHRDPSGEIQPFRPGVGTLARAQRAALVPCLLANTGAALPPGAWWPKRRRLRLRIGEAADAPTLEREGEGEDADARIADALRKRVLALRP
jgi:long-chain acyl-CoA synthetase